MELADRITTIGKETENHTEKIIAAVAHPAQPAAQRHIHVIDFNTSWALLLYGDLFHRDSLRRHPYY